MYFVNSGTEANELAMLMARSYTGNLGMIALRNGYHGGSAGTIGLTALNTWKYPIPQVCHYLYLDKAGCKVILTVMGITKNMGGCGSGNGSNGLGQNRYVLSECQLG